MQINSENLGKDIRRLLIILAKYPKPGLVMTRLAKSIGEKKATDLYRACLADLTPRFAPNTGRLSFDVRWAYIPDVPEFEILIREMYGNVETDGVSFAGHQKPGLADHQIQQLQWAKSSGYHQAVIITTDSPQLSRSVVEDAFDRLTNHDVVIGPTYDGGYFLLGVREHWNVLENVAMSTDHVAQNVIQNTQSLGLSFSTLDKMRDIDTKEDLAAFIELTRDDGKLCPNTLSVLKTIVLEK